MQTMSGIAQIAENAQSQTRKSRRVPERREKRHPFVWEKSPLEKSNPNPHFWSLRCPVRSVSELNDPLITSGDPFWCLKSLGARRCQQESILLLAPVSAQRGRARAARPEALCEIARARRPPGGIYGGQGGGRVGVNGAPLLTLSGTLAYFRIPHFLKRPDF